MLSLYFDHNAGTAAMNATLGFTVEGHLHGIAVVGGVKRGLLLAVWRGTSPPGPLSETERGS